MSSEINTKFEWFAEKMCEKLIKFTDAPKYLNMATAIEDSMFLTPRELRVGNYVNYENTTHVVDEIHQDKLIHHWINSGVDGYVTKYNQIMSIPISYKDIERLGFNLDAERVKFNPDLWFDDNGYCLEDDAGTYWLCQHRDEDDVIRITTVEFVHELQNAYFDLTKKELKY